MAIEPQAPIPKAEHSTVIRRALAAYFADTHEHGWPDADSCAVVRRRGLNYVVLCSRDFEATLAVYRLRRVPGTTGQGQLKRLKRPPRGLG